ncbi:hypothetical protein [Oceanobacillus sp. J11TS1]|uniref:hypothetical protein n=1 Tax=Oceanobacillus sp. J11TS1 TaxID=2807191 RepID=UPI001B1C1AA1|nr:hypothetical protein [Oceanobacillus sp. J11TS1]GIO25156.1 hypothetical protein J11TS1_37370 [Oceanobacillus sp. J11TS1]
MKSKSTNQQELSKEQLQEQLQRQNKMIQALQSEIGIITGEKIAASIAYQEVQQELDALYEERIEEMDEQAEQKKGKGAK